MLTVTVEHNYICYYIIGVYNNDMFLTDCTYSYPSLSNYTYIYIYMSIIYYIILYLLA